jgi:hypothetical protein
LRIFARHPKTRRSLISLVSQTRQIAAMQRLPVCLVFVIDGSMGWHQDCSDLRQRQGESARSEAKLFPIGMQ